MFGDVKGRGFGRWVRQISYGMDLPSEVVSQKNADITSCHHQVGHVNYKKHKSPSTNITTNSNHTLPTSNAIHNSGTDE